MSLQKAIAPRRPAGCNLIPILLHKGAERLHCVIINLQWFSVLILRVPCCSQSQRTERESYRTAL